MKAHLIATLGVLIGFAALFVLAPVILLYGPLCDLSDWFRKLKAQS
jgi:hypothetical protein